MIEWRTRLRVFEELFPFSAYHAAGLSQGLTHWSRSVLTCSVAPIKSPLHIDITAFLKRFARLMLPRSSELLNDVLSRSQQFQFVARDAGTRRIDRSDWARFTVIPEPTRSNWRCSSSGS